MFFHISFRSYIFHISFHRLSCIIQMMGSHQILWLACKICWHSNEQTKKMGKIRWKYNSRIVCMNIELQTRKWLKQILITGIQTNSTKICFTNSSKTIYLWMICDTPFFPTRYWTVLLPKLCFIFHLGLLDGFFIPSNLIFLSGFDLWEMVRHMHT